MTAAVETVTEPARAAVLLNPLRLQIVRELREPDSASGLSRRLSLPRQKLNYHLRELESAGFVELVEERRKGNCIERVLRATATSYLVDPAALGELAAGPEHVPDRVSSSYLIALAAKIIKDVAALKERAAAAKKKLPTLSLSTRIRFDSAESQRAFAEELTRDVARLTAKYQAPVGRAFELVVGAYPASTKSKGEGST